MPEIKKQKIEIKDEVDASADAALDKLMTDQSVAFYKIHDKLKASLKKAELIEILEKNKQEIPVGTPEVNFWNQIFLLCQFWIHFLLRYSMPSLIF